MCEFCNRAEAILKNTIEEIEINVNKDMFISRIDSYYGKIFMIAKLYFSGERELFV